MDAIPFPCARGTGRVLGALVTLTGLVAVAAVGAAAPLSDTPVIWHEDDRRDIAEPAERDPNLLWGGPRAALKRPAGRMLDPVRWVRRAGTAFGGDHVPPAANTNSLDELPNSSWFTNRIGLFPMTPEQAAQGPGSGSGPETEGPWTITRAKTEGVTPGFNIRDAAGNLFLVKFDSQDYPNISTAAGVISGLIFHSAGYNVPDDVIVHFRRENLVLEDGVRITLPDGSKRTMVEADIDAILARVPKRADGLYRGVSSRFLSGKPLGPFDYKGTRDDDPNDRIPHQDRRELRGLRLFAAWLLHFDTKEQNSLDMFVEEDGRRFVRHHLIDFASTLGTGALGPKPTQGREYSWDTPAIFGRLFALGFHEDAWRKVERPEGLSEIGYFPVDRFDPLEFKPLVPNSAFANFTDRDGYWAAKIISAFSDEHLRAIVARGEYEDPAAAEYMVSALAGRRDLIARQFFDRISPLEYFRLQEDRVTFRDLGEERGVYPGTTPRYRWRAAATGEDRSPAGGWSPWVETEAPLAEGIDVGATPVESHPFLAVQVQVSRGDGWGRSISAYFSRQRSVIVAMNR